MKFSTVPVFAVVLAGRAIAAPAPPAPAPPAPAPARPLSPEMLARVPPELRYTRIPLPDDQNAFISWSQATARLVALADPDGEAALAAMLDEENGLQATAGGAKVLAWLRQNEEALALLNAGLRRGRCQFPEVTGLDTEMPYLLGLKRLAELKLVRAKLQASLSQHDAAAAELTDLLRLGDMVCRGDGVLIVYIVGLSIQERGAEGIRWLVAQPGVPEAALARLAAAAAPPPGEDDGLAQAIRGEVPMILLPVVSRQAAADPDSPRALDRLAADRTLFDPAATLDLVTGFYVRFLRNAEAAWTKRDREITPDLERLAKAVAGVPGVLRVWVEWSGGTDFDAGATPMSDADCARLREQLAGARDADGRPVSNPLGKGLVALGLPAIELEFRERTDYRADREAARALAALKIYFLRKGRLPESLQSLVDEKILPSLPGDPFSGQPLRYSREKRLLWSVGEDEKDDGGEGAEAEDRFDGKDYAWRVP